MDECARNLMKLKAELAAAKNEHDQLSIRLHDGEIDAEDAGDIHPMEKEHSRLRQEVESYRRQVAHQRNDSDQAAEKIKHLEVRLREMRDRRTEAAKKNHKTNREVTEIETEVLALQKQLKTHQYQKKEHEAERFKL